MPDNARMKLQETLIKIVNQGNGGLIAIMLIMYAKILSSKN